MRKVLILSWSSLLIGNFIYMFFADQYFAYGMIVHFLCLFLSLFVFSFGKKKISKNHIDFQNTSKTYFGNKSALAMNGLADSNEVFSNHHSFDYNNHSSNGVSTTADVHDFHSNGHDYIDHNPATGLVMSSGGLDVGGNFYGVPDHHSYDHHRYYD